MATPAHDKYYLRSLHEEIDLFDRKLAHSENFGVFGSAAEKSAAADKMKMKRELLVRTAQQLVNDGIQFKASELPRSFRKAEAVADQTPAPATPEPAVIALPPVARKRRAISHFAGTLLDGQAHLEEYKRSRAKAAASQD